MLVQALEVGHKSCQATCLPPKSNLPSCPCFISCKAPANIKEEGFYLLETSKHSSLRNETAVAGGRQPVPGAGTHSCVHTQPWLTHPTEQKPQSPACPLDTLPAQLPPAIPALQQHGLDSPSSPPAPSEVWAAGQTRLMTCLGG